MIILSPDHLQAITRGIREEGLDHDAYWLGFSWYDIQAPPRVCNQLVEAGIFHMGYASRSTKSYRVSDIEAAGRIVRQATESSVAIDLDVDLTPPDDFLDVILGHDRTKSIIKLSLLSERPVHVLLVGAPATAKSLFLDEVARMPNSRQALGATTSSAGLVDFLIEEKPAVLIIDEIDKMAYRDQTVLLSLMESGRVSRLKRGMRENIVLSTRVYGGANSLTPIQAPLLSRFTIQHLSGYSEADFRAIAISILIKRERVIPSVSEAITNAITGKTKDPRDAVKVARMVLAGGDIKEIVSSLWS